MTFVGLTEFLKRLEQVHSIRLHKSNLTAKREVGSTGPESMLERLERQGLARSETRGTRRHWLVALEALETLAAQARSARPGPPPGVQVTLSAEEVARFIRELAAYEYPEEHIVDALRTVTESIEGVERVVIPVHPRRTPTVPR